MEIKVIRKTMSDICTTGELWINDKFFCYTLEDVIREKKIMHETAIPDGKYEVILSFSNRFKKIMPLLLSVPGFEGIRIHSGNTKDDTSGCILVGKTLATNFIGESRDAFTALMFKLKVIHGAEKIFITVQ